ncbi:MAG: hypothetical protein HY319_16915 [Armatimonadetes bacterium]|nr:hypothetical protein [Armatimonadota bacterium]
MISMIVAREGSIYLFPAPCLLASAALLIAVAYLQARAQRRSWCPFGLPSGSLSSVEVAVAWLPAVTFVLICLTGPWQIYLLFFLGAVLIGLSLRQREIDPDDGRLAAALLRGGWAVALSLTLLTLQGVPLAITPVADVGGCTRNLRGIGRALETYRSDHDGEYPASLAQLTPDYLTELPRCGPPQPARALYECQGLSFGDRGGDYDYTVTPEGYTVCCKSDAHQRTTGCPAGFPRSTSEEGILIRPSD